MTVREWIGINMKAFPLPFYAAFWLMAAPPLGKRCKTCWKDHGGEVCAFSGLDGQPGDPFAGCDYAFCDNRRKHTRKVCPTLNHRCGSCLFRGHRAESKRCGQVDANLAIFEYQAGHGFVTANRTRNWGAANGFRPVIFLAQLHHVAAHRGYARLLTLAKDDVRKILKEGDSLHDGWVGAKPLSTQITTEEAFSKTMYNKDLSEAYVQHYAAGNEYSARLRVPPEGGTGPGAMHRSSGGKPTELCLQQKIARQTIAWQTTQKKKLFMNS
jgi:hypothetical protein